MIIERLIYIEPPVSHVGVFVNEDSVLGMSSLLTQEPLKEMEYLLESFTSCKAKLFLKMKGRLKVIHLDCKPRKTFPV